MSRHTLKSHLAHHWWPVPLCSAYIKLCSGPMSGLLQQAADIWAALSGLSDYGHTKAWHLAEALSWAGSCILLNLRDGPQERKECRDLINGHKYHDRRGPEEINKLIVAVCPPFLGSSVYTKSVLICICPLVLQQWRAPRTQTQFCELKIQKKIFHFNMDACMYCRL